MQRAQATSGLTAAGAKGHMPNLPLLRQASSADDDRTAGVSVQGVRATLFFDAKGFPMTLPLMPKATAVWLIEKTALSFTQIAEFCGLHPLEVQAIADGEVAQGIVGYDPVANGQLTTEEIRRCEADPEARLQLAQSTIPLPKRARGARYTPVAKRNDRPNGIAYLLRNYPQLSDAQIAKLMGTTKETIQKVRNHTHCPPGRGGPRPGITAAVPAFSCRRAAVRFPLSPAVSRS